MCKPFKTIDEQIDILQSRGMSIADTTSAKVALSTISYYRLSGYSYPFRQYSKEKQERLDQFVPNTTLEQVLALYAFDERLRLATFQQLSRIEVALRALVGYAMGKENPYIHLTPSLLGPAGFNKRKQRRTDEYNRWEGSYSKSLKPHREDFIRHYIDRHEGKLPIWVAVHVLEWGQLATLLKMAPLACQDTIAGPLHLSASQLHSWLDSLRILRNICAHQGRLFNRTLRKVKLPENTGELGMRKLSPKKNKCFDQLTLVQYLTREMGLGGMTALPRVLATFPASKSVPVRATGAPDNWQSLPLWNPEGAL